MSEAVSGSAAVGGWLLAHGAAVFWGVVVLAVLVTVGRVGYTVLLALADLKLRRSGGDAAAELAAWLRKENGGVDPSARGRGGARGRSLLYQTYMHSPEWAARRQRAVLLAGRVCQGCGARGPLEVHHRTYARLGQEADGDLIALCPDCHAHQHGR